jgi:calcineurin-like phosphoesterase
MAYYLDGRVDAVIGTHTHVPTCDNIVLPKGTLYISDVGMTGAKYSIIGGSIEQGIRKFLTGVPERVKPQKESLLQFNAVLLDLINKKIERINIFE